MLEEEAELWETVGQATSLNLKLIQLHSMSIKYLFFANIHCKQKMKYLLCNIWETQVVGLHQRLAADQRRFLSDSFLLALYCSSKTAQLLPAQQ